MSGARTVIGLLVGIGAVIAAHFAIDVRTDSAPKGLRRNSLAPDAESATVISIARAGEPATEFVRENAWRIVRPFAANADQGAVLRVVDMLAYSPVAEEMTDAELLRLGRTRDDFGLGKPRIVVRVGDSEKGGTVISFGSATPAGDGVYATVGAAAAVYLVSSNAYAAVDRNAATFRCHRILSVDLENVAAFDIKSGAGHFVRLSRNGEAWELNESRGSVASSVRVRGFLETLIGLEARSFVWPSGGTNDTGAASVSLLAGYGLDPESSVSVTLKCRDGSEQVVSFGRESGQNCVYALAQGGNAIVTVPSAIREAAMAGEGTFVDTRLFPVDKSAVTALSLDDGRLAILLSRGTDGAWRLDAPASALADQEAVAELVDRLLALHVSDAVAEGVSVSIGAGVEPVVVSGAALFGGLRPDDLRSKEIVKLDAHHMKRVVVTDRGKKPVSVVFDADRSSWMVESAEAAVAADGVTVSKLVAAMCPLKATRIARLKVAASELDVYGLDKPLRTIAVDQTDENSVRRNILIGDVTDGGRFATLGSSDAVFVISSESAAALLAPIAK